MRNVAAGLKDQRRSILLPVTNVSSSMIQKRKEKKKIMKSHGSVGKFPVRSGGIIFCQALLLCYWLDTSCLLPALVKH